MPYLSIAAISDAIDHIATTYPALAQIIALPVYLDRRKTGS